jgi:hypothetical protein
MLSFAPKGRAHALKRLIFFAAAIAVAGAAPAEAKRAKLPPYPKALRCAGLTLAAELISRGAGTETPDKFDHALFWGLATSEAARKAKKTGTAFEDDVTSAGAIARAEIERGDKAALAELDRCVRAVPPLKRKQKG